jgi:lipoprotein NlpI
MMACISDLSSSDPMGRGLGLAFGAMFGAALWIILAVLLIIGGVKGEMPHWAGIVAIVLLPLSAVSATIAVDSVKSESGWSLVVPALLPPVIAGYAIWARLPQLHRVLPAQATSSVTWLAVLLLTLAPMPRYASEGIARSERARQQQREDSARNAAEEQRRQEILARFQKLTADSPLWEWAAFIGKDSELDAQAVAGARKLAHRQADAETALQRGMGFPLIEYWRLGLDATSGLCMAARDFLNEQAAAHPPPTPDTDADAAYDVIRAHFSPYLEAVEWLTQKDCGIDDAVARIAATVAAYPQSRSRDGFLAILAWRRGNGFYKRDLYDRALASYDEAIRFAPDDDQLFDSRGNLYYDKAEYDRAIADYSEAIRLNRGYSAAFDSRANAYHQKGDDDRALQDYDETLRLNPEFALAFNNRAVLYDGRGDHEQAIRDYDEAVRLAPKFRLAFGNRGRSRFYQGRYPDAVADFAAALELKPDDPYGALWLYLARARAGQSAMAELQRDAGPLDRVAWPWPVVAALLKDQDRVAALDAAQHGDATTQKGQMCEADFFFGADAAAAGDISAAGELLRQAQTLCPTDFIEYTAATFELARLPQ